jgi:hypothetical protein
LFNGAFLLSFLLIDGIQYRQGVRRWRKKDAIQFMNRDEAIDVFGSVPSRSTPQTMMASFNLS